MYKKVFKFICLEKIEFQRFIYLEKVEFQQSICLENSNLLPL